MENWNSWNTLEELSLHFSDEQVCVSYLYNLKWPHGFECPRCQHSHAYVINTRRLPLYECSACHHQTSLTADTIMENSRTPLQKWITAIWLVSQHNVNINAIKLRSIIQVTYKTAWSILHKIRSVISAIDVDSPLEHNVQGIVEYHCKPLFRSTLELLPYEHPLIVAATISSNDQIIRLKIKTVNRQHLYGRNLHPIACSHFIDLHTCTEASSISIISHLYRAQKFHTLKRAFKQARSWMIDTFHGIGIKYLQRYLDEFCFRSNARSEHYSAWELLIRSSMSNRYRSLLRQNTISSQYLAA
ncbi:transposase [Paenibacillus marinisediminis]